MAAHLSRPTRSGWLGLCLIGVALPLAAQTLHDPTRPPQGAMPAAEVEHAGGQRSSELQSILISPQRRVAIINGRSVAAGDLVGDARVVRILENEVVLRAGSEVRVLRMYPDVEKKPAAPAAASRSNNDKK